ncbi:YbfB/YjiJ family MFS transporter [Antrihabitans cavernicola]|uniref:YbfB/YjiJ family MFS transporter n=1 Tax=Antrihabitans cavernicola TaxID=2495913 RepID=A0A5A7S8A5_9NOCA|nr:YbfB/YjiJ family MFS transporter [Spelaeibacter cavernicola]KAA0018414.1 YbfB/YjiJ family MFS transporter [Spelaeibacter cavernicola]
MEVVAPNGRRIAVTAAAGLAAAMGVGRFVFTPLLPIMIASAHISANDGGVIATANYGGYLLGAVLLSVRPELSSTRSFRAWALILVISEAAMAFLDSTAAFSVARFLAGWASAAIFVGCASTVTRHRADGAAPGIAFAGVGVGIAVSGLLTFVAGQHLSWNALWLCSAVITAALVAPALNLQIASEPRSRAEVDGSAVTARVRTVWRLLLASYFLEGLGYIIVGTFLVAAVGGERSSATGPLVWILVGVSAVPATVLWSTVARRTCVEWALVSALVLQAIGTVLPALTSNSAVAMICAILFGGTFIGIVMLAMDFGSRLPIGRTAATLTALYSVGQVLGPLVVAPVIGSSYASAFAIASAVLVAASVAAIAVAVLATVKE